MGDTYSRILESSKEVWQLEQAQILINIEDEIYVEGRKTGREKYQLKIKDQKKEQKRIEKNKNE